jgi:hypothetical protein
MPAYTNRPALPGNTAVLRRLGREGLIATLRDRQLRFTRIDKLEDTFEGSAPQAEIDAVTPALIGAASQQHMWMQLRPHYPELGLDTYFTEDPWTRVSRYRRAMTKATHACSWSHGDESDLMWRRYCADDGIPGCGVALRTTLDRLETSVAAHDLYVSPIIYREYHTPGTGKPVFSQQVDAMFHKRSGYKDEREVRLLKYNEHHYGQLANKATVVELPEYEFLGWEPADVLDAIVISPYSDEAHEQEVRDIVHAHAPTLDARVELSTLERPGRARF